MLQLEERSAMHNEHIKTRMMENMPGGLTLDRLIKPREYNKCPRTNQDLHEMHEGKILSAVQQNESRSNQSENMRI